MWPLKCDEKSAKTRLVLVPQRACVCGHKHYSAGKFSDLLNCTRCGAVYYTGVLQPVARYEEVCDENK